MNGLSGPDLLTEAHVVDGFDCGEDHLNTWLRRRARRNQADGSSRTWVVADDERVVGFYASSAAVLLRASATRRAARNQPDPLPAFLLGRLAVDQKHQGRGLGAALLKHFLLKSIEIADVTGVRVLLVHAKDQSAAAFYQRYGFEPSPIDDLTLMLLVKDLRA
ncbi:MAG: GNAT family N-acetyltransferase [Acidimicrobiales bacterium]|nr:GNAT family N-acetyltransferase [Acidimicrobiales bacterium]